MNTTSAPPFTAAYQRTVVDALRAVLPERCVLFNEEDTRPYECDGLAAYAQLPMVVVLPDTEAQVIAAIKVCHALKVPIVPRGAGTGSVSYTHLRSPRDRQKSRMPSSA